MSKALRNKGSVIKLDKERRINIDMNALVELEDKYGSIDKAFGALSGSPKMKDIRYILYLSLLHEDESLTENKVGKLIDIGNIGYVIETIGSAIELSMPEVDEEDVKN